MDWRLAVSGKQPRHSRRSVWVTRRGEILTLKQWSAKLGVPYPTVWDRIEAWLEHGSGADHADAALEADEVADGGE